MIASSISRRLVDLACLAPSVHNTQPWRWSIRNDRVLLWADRTRALPAEDPWGRNLAISCGAALHHLRFAAHALGFAADVTYFPEGTDSDLLAEVRLHRGDPSPTPSEDLEALRLRCTDRRRFTSWPVPDIELEGLAKEAQELGATALAVTDVTQRFRLELLSNQAHEQRADDSVALLEQDSWLGRSGHDGIPLEVLPKRDDGRQPRSRFGAGLVPEVRNGIESGDGAIILGGPADDTQSWLHTGEGLSALWLRATRAGLSVVPLSLPIEVEQARHDLHQTVLAGAFVPHLVVRIGWQAMGRSDLPRTPRRPVDEILVP